MLIQMLMSAFSVIHLQGQGNGYYEPKAKPIPFYVTADDHGLAYQAEKKTTLLIEPGARYDVVLDFMRFGHQRIIMKNILGDEPYGGDVELKGPDRKDTGFDYMDRIMAFDVVNPFDKDVNDNFDPHKIDFPVEFPDVDKTRRLGLFEGRDAYGRLQPLLGTIDKAVDDKGAPVYWPDKKAYQIAGLAGKQMEGTMGWHEPTTEIVRIGDTEYWEIWNLTEGKLRFCTELCPANKDLIAFFNFL